MTLTKFPPDPLLDLQPWVGQRSATFRFDLTNGVTGAVLGQITPIRGANLSHDISRTMKRQLRFNLGSADTAAINPLTDRVSPFMVFPSGVEYPLGRYMFTDSTRQKFTSGKLSSMLLSDEMFLVDQQITSGLNGVNFTVLQVIFMTLSGLPITVTAETSSFNCRSAWTVGASRGQILEALSVAGDFFSPWFDNNGILRFIRTFNPAAQVPDFDWDSSEKVIRTPITETDELLTAPNVFIVISNNSDNPDSPTIGIASVPVNAPNSIVNRGFSIPQVADLQLSDSTQAQAVAEGLAQRNTIFERVVLTTAPDPRHDGYNVIRWDGANWLELSWEMSLMEGGAMTHVLRKSYAG